MEGKRVMMLACRNIEDEIEAAMKEAGVDYPVVYLPSGAHNNPQTMNQILQKLLDTFDGIDYLILPMGRCGNATLGLCSEKFSLVLPRCEDCVNLLLSEDSLKVDRPKGRMFFTRGWLSGKLSEDNAYRNMVVKYGEDKAKMLSQMIYGGYSAFCLLDTGLYDVPALKERLTPLAEAVPVCFEERKVSYGVLKQMVSLDLENGNFVTVPPGTPVTAEMLELKE